MPPIAGYILSEDDVRILREFLYVYNRQQRYVNAFGRGPDNKIDHEEMHTSELYIARSSSGGIPALQSFGSTGIGDIPGSALCTVFKTSQSADLTEDVTGYQHTVYNISTSAIPGDTWLIIVRDKYGKWYALQSISSGQFETLTGPGWTAGLSNEDCLLLTVSSAVGICSTIPAQEIILISDDAITWEGLDNFIYSGGVGAVQFTRIANHSLPTLTIGAYTLIWDAAGIDVDGNYWIEFKGGTALCSDIEGTGSGTGGARGACGTNTFTVRLTCSDCAVLVEACCGDNPQDQILNVALSGGTGAGVVLNGATFQIVHPGGDNAWGNTNVTLNGVANHFCTVGCQTEGPNIGKFSFVVSTITPDATHYLFGALLPTAGTCPDVGNVVFTGMALNGPGPNPGTITATLSQV